MFWGVNRPDTKGLSMGLLPLIRIPGMFLQFLTLLAIGGGVYLFVWRNRERDRNDPLRGEIEARVCFETPLTVPAFSE